MNADVAIVGAGTAGAAAALQCARRGLSVVCLDRGKLGEAGARWVNGVPASAFTQAELALPEGDERLGGDHAFHLIAGWGPDRLTMQGHDVLEVDMRRLVERLQAGAAAAGAQLRGEVEVEGFDADAGLLQTSDGELQAAWLVDASGLTGARLLGQPKVAKEHLCVASQQVRRADPAGGAALYAEHGAKPGETLCFTGVSGGYSIVNVRVHDDSVALLTGGIPGLGFQSGVHLLDAFVRDHPWIGERLFGGSRAIPIRRPHDRIAGGRVALLGDSACQVFPAHGSGIGAQLVAAHMLGEALSEGGEDAAERYGVRWMRRHGGMFAAYDAFRRFSQSLTIDETRQLMRSGLMDRHTTAAGLEQRLPAPTRALLPTLPRKLAGLVQNPGLAGRIARMGVTMGRALAAYRRYPQAPGGLDAWAQQVAGLFGESAVL